MADKEPENTIKFVTTKHGNPKLIDWMNYEYQSDGKNKKGGTYYRCCKRKMGCQGRGILSADQKFVITQEHVHSTNSAKIEIEEMNSNLKKLITNNKNSSTSAILEEATRNLSAEAVVKLPKDESIKRKIRRAKRKMSGFGTEPKCAFDITWTDSIKNTLQGELFLFWDSYETQPTKDRIIVFSTNNNLEYLSRADIWLQDGTFKSCPKVFKQLYTIHAKIDGVIVPLVYTFLMNKKQSTYDRLFRKLKSGPFALNPKFILMDYEKAAINSSHKCFPLAKISGCLFHFSQCLLRRVQKLGMMTNYFHDEKFRSYIKSFVALSFVPIEDVKESFAKLAERCPLTPTNLKKFLEYYESTFIGTWRKPALFVPDLWNVRDRVEQDVPRTTNFVEGFHHSFMSRLQTIHPSWEKIVLAIKTEQNSRERQLVQANSGITTAQAKKYEELDIRLKNILPTYSKKPLERYLDGIHLLFDFTYHGSIDESSESEIETQEDESDDDGQETDSSDELPATQLLPDSPITPCETNSIEDQSASPIPQQSPKPPPKKKRTKRQPKGMVERGTPISERLRPRGNN